MTFDGKLYDEVDASGQGFLTLEPGIYLCKVTSVEDFEDKQYLKVKFDIADGVFKDYFKNQEKQFDKYPRDGYDFWSYKEAAMPFFKGRITSLEKSNSGYDFKKSGHDLKTIVGKTFVGIFENEEIPFADETTGNPIVKCRLQKISSTERLAQNDLKFSKDTKPLSDADQEKFDIAKSNSAYTDQVVAERKAETQTKPLPF